MTVVDSGSESETITAGRALGRRLRPGAVVLLHGALGAGKTAFVRGIAEGLGIAGDAVSSPTFTIVQEYRPSNDAWGSPSDVEGSRRPTLQHIDLYRLTPPEVDDLALEDLIEGQVAAIEWPDRWHRAPAGSVRVAIDVLDGDRRRITIEP